MYALLISPSISRGRQCNAADHALSGALQEELKYEEESSEDTSGTPEFIQSFKEKGVWQVRFTPTFETWSSNNRNYLYRLKKP
jgi:hypothetical protein